MSHYVWQHKKWPEFTWNSEVLLQPLAEVRKVQGCFLGRMADLDFDEGLRAAAVAFEEDAIQTAAIEGERLDRESVRSSIARHLGLPYAGLHSADQAVDGLVQVLLDATRNHDRPLTNERLYGWHAALFPAPYSGLRRIRVAAWRDTAMEVVSGPFGRQTVHYEAPPPEQLAGEMKQYFTWWADSRDSLDGIIRAALAHFYFVTLHPFEDGNGRLARSLADMVLAQDEKTGMRFYSLSSQIMKERNAYYDILEKTQKGDGDCTGWLLWFFGCLERAIEAAGSVVENILAKARFWKRHTDAILNERQKKVLNRLLDAGPGGFEGGLTTRKYMGMTKTSRSTAWREIENMLQKGLLKPLPGGGRSTAYTVFEA
ncbi:Fic family protein [Desulfosarcina sp. OttesenSCG-928-A07]|nr:Fic family protein [Desulfosarcina sp. OttesenSCG-928-G17]MDL2330150.1 Fic family protein [Desulfosarcina sp. OttesenSCG-928-A07]